MKEFIKATQKEREDFIREKGMAALGPIMGAVMKEYRGSIGGKMRKSKPKLNDLLFVYCIVNKLPIKKN